MKSEKDQELAWLSEIVGGRTIRKVAKHNLVTEMENYGVKHLLNFKTQCVCAHLCI